MTNAEQARFGRINKPAGQLDAGVLSDGSTGSGLDVFQDGAAIVGYSKASNQIVPINPAEGTLAPEQSIVVPKPSTATGNRVFTAPLVDVRGETIAMIDPAKGEVRAQRVDNRVGHRRPRRASRPRPSRSPRSAATPSVAVGVDGTVYAVSAEQGTITVLRPDGRRGFATPVTTKLGFTSKSAQVTAVGTPLGRLGLRHRQALLRRPRGAPAALGRQRRARATRPSPRCSSPAPTRRRSSSRTRPS